MKASQNVRLWATTNVWDPNIITYIILVIREVNEADRSKYEGPWSLAGENVRVESQT